MLISEATNGFVLARRASGLSPHTIQMDVWAVGLLQQYLGNCDIEEITKEGVRGFFIWARDDYKPTRPNRNNEPLAGAFLDRLWAGVRSFFNFCEEELGLERSDKGVKRPKYKNPIVTPFNEDEFARMLEAAEWTVFTKTIHRDPYRARRPTRLRDIAILLFLLDTGVRASELCRFLVGDIDLDLGEARVRPFNSSHKSKPRTVFIGQKTRNAIWKYRPTREAADEVPLFIAPSGPPMERGNLRHLLVRIGKRAGVKRVYPHRFRHTFAIQYLRNGGDIFTLQRLLGHSSIDMVKQYLALVKGDAREAHRSASPVDRWRL